ncbi:hypothetical protein L0F63_002703 [Massospora cicadina]|nr:hypothetical protein L0F63_002703 [Massospora cicadina]
MSSNGAHGNEKCGEVVSPNNHITKLNELARHFNVVCNTLVYTDVLMLTVLRKHKILNQFHGSINGLISMFGDARKVVRLANFTGFFSKLVYLLQGRGLNPYQALSPIDGRHYYLLIIKAASEFVNGITDDLYCLSRFNVINKDLGTNAKELSIKLWWTSLSIDLYLNLLKLKSVKNKFSLAASTDFKDSEKVSEELELKRPTIDELRAQISNFHMNLIKIIADMVFCGYDLFHIKSNLEYMHLAGVVSGLVGYYRLWVKTNVATKA